MHIIKSTLCLLLLLAPLAGTAAEDPETLIVVNGEEITSADIDALILKRHRGGGMESMRTADLHDLLEKAVNDRLLVQGGFSMGLEEEGYIVDAMAQSHTDRAVRAYVADAFTAPNEVPDDEAAAYFERYYRKVSLRQISAATELELQAVLFAIRGGAPMDSVARAVSIDSRRYEGGSHGSKYWADVENVLREQATALKTGAVSNPFPFRKAWSILRVEERLPADPVDFERFEPSIRRYLRTEARSAAWEKFLAGLLERRPVEISESGFAAIEADSANLFMGTFLRESDEPVLWIESDYLVTAAELRRHVSHSAMTAGTAPFDSLFAASIATKKRDLVLRYMAWNGGFFDDPEILAEMEEELESALLDAYLSEVIVPLIVFKRTEFQEFYDENIDVFRGPGQVKLAMLILKEEQEARDVASRLKGGADFDFLRRRYEKQGLNSSSDSDWAAETIFSEGIRSALAAMDIGDCSEAVEIPSGWLIFRLDNRREGDAPPIEDVDMKIREVMFQRKFNGYLDDHLALLRERSEIVRDEAAIARYLGAEE